MFEALYILTTIVGGINTLDGLAARYPQTRHYVTSWGLFGVAIYLWIELWSKYGPWSLLIVPILGVIGTAIGIAIRFFAPAIVAKARSRRRTIDGQYTIE
jgi:uncharacterized membrane protein YphA (DoxX/SURF4 family)